MTSSKPDSQNPWATPVHQLPVRSSWWRRLGNFLLGREGFDLRSARRHLEHGHVVIFLGVGLQLEPERPGRLLAFSPSSSIDDQRIELVTEEAVHAIRELFVQHQGAKILLEQMEICVQLVTSYQSDRRVLRERVMRWNELISLLGCGSADAPFGSVKRGSSV